MRLPFERLQIWQKGMALAKLVYQLTRQFPKEELYGLTSQMRRSGISIPSNIAEGSQRTSDKEFSNFLLIAKGSLAELKTQILLAQDFQYLNEADATSLLTHAEEIDKMLRAFYQKLTASRFPLPTSK